MTLIILTQIIYEMTMSYHKNYNEDQKPLLLNINEVYLKTQNKKTEKNKC